MIITMLVQKLSTPFIRWQGLRAISQCLLTLLRFYCLILSNALNRIRVINFSFSRGVKCRQSKFTVSAWNWYVSWFVLTSKISYNLLVSKWVFLFALIILTGKTKVLCFTRLDNCVLAVTLLKGFEIWEQIFH